MPGQVVVSGLRSGCSSAARERAVPVACHTLGSLSHASAPRAPADKDLTYHLKNVLEPLLILEDPVGFEVFLCQDGVVSPQCAKRLAYFIEVLTALSSFPLACQPSPSLAKKITCLFTQLPILAIRSSFAPLPPTQN